MRLPEDQPRWNQGDSSLTPTHLQPLDGQEYERLLAEGIRLFNERKFFECHEVLEEIWTPEWGVRRYFLQGIIHVAVGLHHWEQGNRIGARGQFRKGLKKLAGYLPVFDCVDTAALYRATLNLFEAVKRGDETLPPPPHIRRLPA